MWFNANKLFMCKMLRLKEVLQTGEIASTIYNTNPITIVRRA